MDKRTIKEVGRRTSYYKSDETLKIKGHLKLTFRDAITGKIKRISEYDNLICTVGKTMIADNLTNASPDNVMRINYVALGTDATAPSAGDTTLGAEASGDRNTVASETNSNNVAYFTGFFNAPDYSGSFKEAGLFAEGTATEDTGILFSHVAIDETKAVTETLTIDWTVTVS